jgi:hypothetical protein
MQPISDTQDQFIQPGLDANSYDLLKNLVQGRLEDPVLVDEYVGAYAQVANNLNMSIPAFVELLKNQGSAADQDIFLAAYLNQTRVANAKIGVTLNLNTPVHILREIRA